MREQSSLKCQYSFLAESLPSIVVLMDPLKAFSLSRAIVAEYFFDFSSKMASYLV